MMIAILRAILEKFVEEVVGNNFSDYIIIYEYLFLYNVKINHGFSCVIMSFQKL